MGDLEALLRERAEKYGLLRRSSVTAIALDRAADELSSLRERVAALTQYARHKSDCAHQPETLHRFACNCGLRALLSQEGGEG